MRDQSSFGGGASQVLRHSIVINVMLRTALTGHLWNSHGNASTVSCGDMHRHCIERKPGAMNAQVFANLVAVGIKRVPVPTSARNTVNGRKQRVAPISFSREAWRKLR